MIAGGFERGTDGPRVIVASVDGSTTSLRAASYAAGLARRQSAELLVRLANNPGDRLNRYALRRHRRFTASRAQRDASGVPLGLDSTLQGSCMVHCAT